MLIIELIGGLGNQIFQIAAAYAMSKITGHTFAISSYCLFNSHSDIDYTKSIFNKLNVQSFNKDEVIYLRESDYNHDYNRMIFDINNILNSQTIVLNGYFQNFKIFDDYYTEIIDLLNLELNHYKYPELNKSCFLHVRRGDYVGNNYHELNLEDYYKKALDIINTYDYIYIMSNDIEWCKKWNLLKDIKHRFIEEDEVTTLKVMMRCQLGGIAANSSFSWWGLYLNRDRKFMILPNRWFPHNFIPNNDYYFKNVTTIAL